jgi:hypothetical protein
VIEEMYGTAYATYVIKPSKLSKKEAEKLKEITELSFINFVMMEYKAKRKGKIITGDIKI